MPTSIVPIALAIFVAVYNVAQVSCGDKCFNIDEIQQPEWFPCNPSAPTSNCCQSDWICLSNGLCEPTNNPLPDPVTWAGFCTDALWGNTTACPKICQNNLTATGVDGRISSCGNGHFCCYVDNNATECCSTPSNEFFLGVATVVTTINGPSPMPATTSSGTTATSAAVNTPAYPCPDLDDTSYTDATGSGYKIQCNTGYPGNDLPAVHADTFEECLRVCDTYVPEPSAASDASCIGVSWVAGNPGGNCYLKYQITTINTNDAGHSSGYYVNYTLPKSVVTSQGSSPSIKNAPATSGAHSATSTIMRTPTPRGDSDGHVAVGVGAGVGVPVGLAILAGFFYLVRRQSKTRPEGLLELHPVANDKFNNRLREQWAGRRLDELPAENKPWELSDPRGPLAEMSEIRAHRAEIG